MYKHRRKMNRIFFGTIFLLFFNTLSGQQGNIQGTVIDNRSGEPLAGATVTHIESGKKAITDFDGNFTFQDAEPGINEITISYVSYQDAHLKRVIVEESGSTSLKIKMTRAGTGVSEASGLAVLPDEAPVS